MLRIHIDQVRNRALVLDVEENFKTFPVLAKMAAERACEFLAPIRAHLVAERNGGLIAVKGNVAVRVRLTCSRCLEDFAVTLNNRFLLTYTQEPADWKEPPDAAEVRFSAEDAGLIYFRGEEIDLRDGLQEQVVLCFPLQPLCREDCRGLCPQCGANLNATTCACKRSQPDSRFAVLKKLKPTGA